MTSRDRVILTLNHQPVDRIARDLWVTTEMELCYADEVEEMQFRYASDMVRADFHYPRGHRSKGKRREVDEHTDAWGCTWRVPKRGMIGQLIGPPLAEISLLDSYQPPWEVLEDANLSAADESCAGTSRFVIFWSETRPLERLQALCGPEAALAELAVGDRNIRRLLAMLHDFSCREMQLWAKSCVDGVVFMDDWGTQGGLLTSPGLFRDLFKPLYREYCDILHAHDKYAFFHSDGDITKIFGDLVEVGIDAINAQLFSMDIEALAQQYCGQITFWGEVDRLRILPLGTPEQVRTAVCRLQRALDCGRGGVIAQCEWSVGVPFNNIAAALEQWMKPSPALA